MFRLADARIECDVTRMTQLLSNLLGAALAHGDPSKLVRVGARSDGRAFSIEVINGGKPSPLTNSLTYSNRSMSMTRVAAIRVSASGST
jgi:K+-sensing histidine kinase KdpD